MSTAKTFIKIIILFHLTFITHHCVANSDNADSSDEEKSVEEELATQEWAEKYGLYESSKRNYIVYVNEEPSYNVVMTSQLIRSPLFDGGECFYDVFDVRRSTSTALRPGGSQNMASPPDLPEEGRSSQLHTRISAGFGEAKHGDGIEELPFIDYDPSWYDHPDCLLGDTTLGSVAHYPFIEPHHLEDMRELGQPHGSAETLNPRSNQVLLPISPIRVGNNIISPAFIIDRVSATESEEEFTLSGRIQYLPGTNDINTGGASGNAGDEFVCTVVYCVPPPNTRQAVVSVRVRLVNESVVVVSLSSQRPGPSAGSDTPSEALPAFDLRLIPEEMSANASSADDESNRVSEATAMTPLQAGTSVNLPLPEFNPVVLPLVTYSLH